MGRKWSARRWRCRSDWRSGRRSPLLRHHALLRLIGCLGQQTAGYDLAVDLACPLTYLVDLDLPPVAGHRAGLHKALATPDLDGPVGGPLGGLGGEHLGHARLPPEGPAPIFEPRRLEYHVAGELYLHGHVG